MTSLRGRHALVTGAARGIGQAIALALSGEGARLTLVGRNSETLESTAAACREAGAEDVRCIALDLTDREALATFCRDEVPAFEVLVNNAGCAPSAPIERHTDEQWDDSMALNAYAPFALCRAALPAMVGRGRGRIVNIASTAALEGYAFVAGYTASKHALLGLTRALDAELRRRHKDADVTVNALCPGFVDTEILNETVQRVVAARGCSEDEARASLGRMNKGGRLLTPQEVAEAVRELICEEPGSTRGAAVELDTTPR
jgi:NAD(P)-dependent dehydrogenase (short-subunit alcohol dehydrogenase family)